jgi:alcohol dehydrogenase class IV
MVRSLAIARGGAAQLADRRADLGLRSARIVTGAGMLRGGILDPTLADFEHLELSYQIFSDVLTDPPESLIAATIASLH